MYRGGVRIGKKASEIKNERNREKKAMYKDKKKGKKKRKREI